MASIKAVACSWMSSPEKRMAPVGLRSVFASEILIYVINMLTCVLRRARLHDRNSASGVAKHMAWIVMHQL